MDGFEMVYIRDGQPQAPVRNEDRIRGEHQPAPIEAAGEGILQGLLIGNSRLCFEGSVNHGQLILSFAFVLSCPVKFHKNFGMARDRCKALAVLTFHKTEMLVRPGQSFGWPSSLYRETNARLENSV